MDVIVSEPRETRNFISVGNCGSEPSYDLYNIAMLMSIMFMLLLFSSYSSCSSAV